MAQLGLFLSVPLFSSKLLWVCHMGDNQASRTARSVKGLLMLATSINTESLLSCSLGLDIRSGERDSVSEARNYSHIYNSKHAKKEIKAVAVVSEEKSAY